GRQAVLDRVADLHGVLEGSHRDHRDHGPEDLLAGDAHLRRAVAEDRRLVEEAAGVVAGVQPLAAAQQRCALLPADLHVALDGTELALVDAGPHLRPGVGRAVAHFERPGPFHETVHEFLIYLLVYGNPAGRRATLARGAEAAPHGAVHGEV